MNSIKILTYYNNENLKIYSDNTKDYEYYFVLYFNKYNKITDIENGSIFFDFFSKYLLKQVVIVSEDFFTNFEDFLCFLIELSTLVEWHKSLFELNEQIKVFIKKFIDYFEQKSTPNFIQNIKEMFILNNFFNFLIKHFESLKVSFKFWPVYNLPPGFGKTFHNFKFYTFHKKIHITCPTAKAALLYDGIGKTIHSFLKIKPSNSKIVECKYLENEKICITFLNDLLKKSNIIIFDEFSMIGENIFKIIFKIFTLPLYNIHFFLIFTGDSAQLPPVNERQLKKFNNITKNNNIVLKEFKLNIKSDIVVYRFRNFHELQETILLFKEFIDNLKNTKKKSFVLDENSLIFWLKRLKIFNINSCKIDDDLIIHSIINTQNNILDYILKYEKENDQTYLYNIQKFPIIIGYENSYSTFIQEKIYKSSNLNNIDNFKITNVFFPSKFLNKFNVEKILKNLPGNVGLLENIFKKGCLILCKKNYEYGFNGKTCVLLNINLKENENMDYKIIDKYKYNIVDESFDQNTIIYKLYDAETKTIFYSKCEKIIINSCTHCQNFCVHEDYYYFVFNWQTCYSLTVYNLQGQTISDLAIICNTDKVLIRNILKTIYVIFSRVDNPKNLIIDLNFVKKTLSILFNNGSGRVNNKFLKKLNMYENLIKSYLF